MKIFAAVLAVMFALAFGLTMFGLILICFAQMAYEGLLNLLDSLWGDD